MVVPKKQKDVNLKLIKVEKNFGENYVLFVRIQREKYLAIENPN